MRPRTGSRHVSTWTAPPARGLPITMDLQISVEPRDVTGRRTKRLRAAGVVPGVVFGKKAGSVAVQLDAKALEALYREAGRTSIVKVSVDGGSPTSVVIKSIQRNPLTG